MAYTKYYQINKTSFKSAEEITQYISQAVSVLIQDFAQKCDPTLPTVLASHMTVSSGVFLDQKNEAIYGTDPYYYLPN